MTEPVPLQPWTVTKLKLLNTCARKFQAAYVTKTTPYVESDAQRRGKYLHEKFEEYLSAIPRQELPSDLGMHKKMLDEVLALPGTLFGEQKIALDTSLKPCSQYARGVWFRGAIDALIVNETLANVYDWKNGKRREDWEQLDAYAIHTFATHPGVRMVTAQFYWATTGDFSRRAYKREDVPALWKKLMPQIAYYVKCFKSDTWEPKRNALCREYCDVSDCEFWKK
jgi:hypothetical protein